MGPRRGFTLVEIALAAGLVGILATAGVWLLGGETDEARLKTAQGALASLDRRVMARAQLAPGYHFDTLEAALAAEAPLDPWGRPYLLLHPTGGAGDPPRFGAHTAGPRGCPGTMAPTHLLVSLGPPGEGPALVPELLAGIPVELVRSLKLGAPAGDPCGPSAPAGGTPTSPPPGP